MDSYISHVSAALLWEVPLLHVVLGHRTIEDLTAALCAEHMTSDCEEKRQKQVAVHAHVNSLPLPKGSVVEHKGRRVACPELVFLELAPHLGFQRTILLGMQLCSSTVGGTPITTVARIRRFVAHTQGQRGHKIATQAAQYLADGSASVMESLLHMLLTLPNMHGGYGLGGAVLNHEISLEGKKTSLPNKRVFADLFWPKPKLVVEYDSYEYHNNLDSWLKDARRLSALERLGYRTLSINTVQLYNTKAFEEVALIIASALDKRIRIRTARFAPAQAELRSLLPRSLDAGNTQPIG